MYSHWNLLGIFTLLFAGLNLPISAERISLLKRSTTTAIRVQQCREGCLEKFAIKEELCQQRPECSTCWDECAKPPPPKINKTIRETWALRTVSMLQQDSLVLVDVAWAPLNTPSQCLVTWEVSGGGLMGNLLTESSSVQLSLWPDTKYRVQVTCKNKETGAMSRSLPLTIDTTEAASNADRNRIESTSTSTPIPSSSSSSSSSPYSSSSSSVPSSFNSSSIEEPSSSLKSNVKENKPMNNNDLPDDSPDDDSLNRHTNFIFNWQNSNADISVDKIEPLEHPDLNLLTIVALSDMQKPLLFGVIAGTLLLAVILCLYVCMLRNQRIPSDKKALIDDDGNATSPYSASPVVTGHTNHLGLPSNQQTIMDSAAIPTNRPLHILTV